MISRDRTSFHSYIGSRRAGINDTSWQDVAVSMITSGQDVVTTLAPLIKDIVLGIGFASWIVKALRFRKSKHNFKDAYFFLFSSRQ